jgi:hypothetical protein
VGFLPMRDVSFLRLGSLLSIAIAVLNCSAPEEIDRESVEESAASPVEAVAPERVEEVDLAGAEESVFSQNGEDGVLRRIFEIVEPTARFAVEFGAADGVSGSNVRNLVVNAGWDAFLMEGDAEQAQACAQSYADYPGTRCIQAWVYPGNVELLFEENSVPKDLDLLVIDIDSNDWYVWRVIHAFRPKIVMIEYNSLFAPPTRMVIDFHPLNYWDETTYFGASIQSLYELGKKKGYELLYGEKNGVNLFFVDAIYYDRFGIRDNSPEKIFRPYKRRYYVSLEQLSALVDEEGRPRSPHDKDLVWDEVRIEKRFLMNQR